MTAYYASGSTTVGPYSWQNVITTGTVGPMPDVYTTYAPPQMSYYQPAPFQAADAPGYPARVLSPLEWLDAQVEATCRIARQ